MYILLLSSNSFHVLWNIPTIFSITHRGHSCECKICAQFIVMGVRIYDKYFCDGVGSFKGVRLG